MNTTFLDACIQKKTAYTPVWYMRQAGRYLPEYQKIKGSKNILDVVRTPELAAKITLQPVEILNVDAAVLYADIMIPLLGIGVDLEIVESIGPIIKNPIRSLKEVKQLRKLETLHDIAYLLETIGIVRKELKNRVPLIGFSAAPFTLASYLIEGRPTRDFIKTKSLMYSDRKTWNLLMEKLSDIIIVYLEAQVTAGIQAIQLFDSWVGCLSSEDFQEYVLPHSQKIFSSLQKFSLPRIHFGTNTAAFLKDFSSVDCEVISVDWRMQLSDCWKQIGYQKGIQGNLDPVLLFADFPLIKKRVDELFDSLPKLEGYIFNLGHGVLPGTPIENIKRLTEYVHTR